MERMVAYRVLVIFLFEIVDGTLKIVWITAGNINVPCINVCWRFVPERKWLPKKPQQRKQLKRMQPEKSVSCYVLFVHLLFMRLFSVKLSSTLLVSTCGWGLSWSHILAACWCISHKPVGRLPFLSPDLHLPFLLQSIASLWPVTVWEWKHIIIIWLLLL